METEGLLDEPGVGDAAGGRQRPRRGLGRHICSGYVWRVLRLQVVVREVCAALLLLLLRAE